MALERLDPALQVTIFTLDHYARYLFANSLARNARVLDIACGYGYGSFLLAEAGAREVIGVDVSDDALAYAREHYLHERVAYHQANITAVGPDTFGLFDLIVSFETLEHIDDPVRAVEALTRLLTPSGVLLISVPNDVFHKVENPFHRTKFTESDFLNLLRDRFTYINSYYQNFAASSIVWRADDPALRLASEHRHLVQLAPTMFGRIDGDDNAQAADCFIALCSNDHARLPEAVVVQSSQIWREHNGELIEDRDRLWQEVQQWHGEFLRSNEQVETLTADRDRLWHEVQVWHDEAQNTQTQLTDITADRDRLWQEAQQWHAEFLRANEQVEVLTADRDRVWQEVQQWHGEAQNAQTQLVDIEADRNRLWQEVQLWQGETQNAQAELAELAVQSSNEKDRIEQKNNQLTDQLLIAQKELKRFENSRLHQSIERIRHNGVYRVSRTIAFPLYQRVRKTTRAIVVKQSANVASAPKVHVEIRATGKQNDLSGGCEVWLLDIMDGALEPLPWNEIPTNDQWKRQVNERSAQGSGLVATGEASLELNIPATSVLRLLSHPWSGIAIVKVGDTSQEIDLYSPIPEVKTVRIASTTTLQNSFKNNRIAPSQRHSESELRWIETIQHERPDAVAVMHPDWRGVRSASENLFSYRYYQDDTLDEESARRKARVFADAGLKRVVLCGFPYTYRHLVSAIKKETPSTNVYVFWLSNFLQSNEDYSWTVFKQIDHLCRQGLITKWGFAKHGMAEIVGQTGVPTGFLASCVRTIPTVPSVPLQGGPHLGMWAIEPIWRKSPYAMLAATSMIPNAHLHSSGQNERAAEFASYFKLKADIQQHSIDQRDMPATLASMHLNLYVTLSECSPMVPLESLAVGSPCLFGPTSHLFEDNPYLHSRLVVPYPDRAFEIAKYIEQALAERNQIIAAYQKYAPGYNKQARQSVCDFLEVDSDAIL